MMKNSLVTFKYVSYDFLNSILLYLINFNSHWLKDRWIDLSDDNPVESDGELDNSIDIILKGAKYEAPWTVVRLSRSLNTDDSQDVPITVSA